MKQNIIREKASDFAVRIVDLTRYLKKKKAEAVLINQLLRSGVHLLHNREYGSHAWLFHKFVFSIFAISL